MTGATMEQLRSVPILSSCTDEELDALAQRAELRDCPPGWELIRQGEPGAALYVLLSGEADIVIDGVRRHSVQAGDIVGEISMLGGGTATATAVVTSVLSVLVLAREDFEAIVGRHGTIALRVITVLLDRMRDDARRLAEYNHTLLDYLEQVEHVTSAAAAVEDSTFEPRTLDQIAIRDDELGRLARVFQRMAVEVAVREQHLQQEVHRLRITIDQTRLEEQISAITETDYFRTLQYAAEQARTGKSPRGDT